MLPFRRRDPTRAASAGSGRAGPAPPRRSLRSRATALGRRVRRTVLVRRRLLAALLTAAAVAGVVEALSPPDPETRSVLTAAVDLPAGTVVSAEDLVTVDLPPGAVPDGAVDSESAVGQRLASPLRRGEPVTDVRLVSESLLAGRPGEVAVPLRIPDPGSVELVDVGDRVDVLATDPRGREPATTVVSGARVLALPDAGSPGSTGVSGAAGGRLVVLAVERGLAPQLAAATARYSLSLTLWG